MANAYGIRILKSEFWHQRGMQKPISAAKLQRLRDLDPVLVREIRGQDHVLQPIIAALRRGELGLTKPGRPKGSFLLLGPTGVGKTEATVVFTNHLFGCEKLFRFDMSEFQTQESIALLLGGKLGERGFLGVVREKANEGTILFDEVEKAHPRVMDLFLQMLDAARLTVATGETLDFSGFYLVMTSNIGSAELLGLQHSSESTMERHVMTRAQQSLRPEVFARISEKLVFHRLSYEHQLEIAEKFLLREIGFLETLGYKLTVTDEVLPFLVRQGFHPKLGARPMRDAVERSIGVAVSQALLEGRAGSGCLDVDVARGLFFRAFDGKQEQI